MFRLVQLCVRRVPAAVSAGRGASVPGSARTVVRLLSTSTRTRTRTRDRDRVRICTVDPNLEEQFVFPEDFTGPEDDRDLIHHLTPPSPSPSPSPSAPPPPQKHLRSLERQLQVLRGGAQQEAEPDSLIQFQDVDFPLDQDLVSAETRRKRRRKSKGEHKVFGTPDLDEPVSDTCCSGCGAVLHCAVAQAPGYLPSEKYKVLAAAGGLDRAVCQRCHLLTHHHKALDLQLPRHRFRDLVTQIRPRQALVLLVVDLLDLPDSIVPDLPGLVGTNKHVVVLGNKVDLLPGDAPGYLRRIRQRLGRFCAEAGFGSQVTGLHLISAKTGYGIEQLISSLQRSWKYRGDVYLVGSANAGKSTLFNSLLDSDFCKSKASDLIRKATISPWPGTTLNLLKFPIINPTPYRMFRRRRRLEAAAAQTEDELTAEEQRRLRTLSREGYLIGRVGRTFRSDVTSRPDEIQFDPDSLALGETDQDDTTGPSKMAEEFSFNELKDARWLFDTPGILKENDILSLLNEQEVRSVVPTQAVVPRTFVLKPCTSLFVGALARIDFLQGNKSCWFSVVASARVPVHITSLEKADSVYEKHAGHVLLGVPAGGSERMKQFPALVPQEFKLQGRGHDEAAADITLSSAGWVAVTAVEGDDITLRVHCPESVAFGLRTPPLLPHIVSLKGRRIGKSCSYKPMKAAGLLDSGLTAGGGGGGLQVKKKKKKK